MRTASMLFYIAVGTLISLFLAYGLIRLVEYAGKKGVPGATKVGQVAAKLTSAP